MAEDYHDFEEQLRLAKAWERRIMQAAGESIFWEEVERLAFADDPDGQRAGIDLYITERSFAGVQTKVRLWPPSNASYAPGDDVFYETVSVVKNDTPGWVWTYDDILVIYCWLDRPAHNIYDSVLFYVNDEFRTWFDNARHNYPEFKTRKPSVRHGDQWYSKGVPIPVEDVPSGFIRTNVDITIPIDVVTEQTTFR